MIEVSPRSKSRGLERGVFRLRPLRPPPPAHLFLRRLVLRLRNTPNKLSGGANTLGVAGARKGGGADMLRRAPLE
jgi:hypothetical protein